LRLASEALRSGPREELVLEGVLRVARGLFSWQLHLCSLAGAALAMAAAAAAVAFFSSLRVRSREVSARLPRRDRASRRANTSSRLGLEIGRGVERLALGEAAGREGALEAAREARAERLGVAALLAGGLLTGAGAATGELVRVGRASSAVRTRLGPDV